jgi:hypothetical protein
MQLSLSNDFSFEMRTQNTSHWPCAQPISHSRTAASAWHRTRSTPSLATCARADQPELSLRCALKTITMYAPCTDHTLLDRVAWRGVRHCRTNILSPGTCGDAGSQNPTGPNATCYTCWKADGQGKCTVPIEGCQVVEECGWPLMMSEVWGRYPCESNPHSTDAA